MLMSKSKKKQLPKVILMNQINVKITTVIFYSIR